MNRVYICSRFRASSPEELRINIDVAKWGCRKAVDSNYKPLCPHLFYPQFLNDDDPDERRKGLDMALDDLKSCQAVWVIKDGRGVSEGMKEEMELAESIGKCVRNIRTEDYEQNYIAFRKRKEAMRAKKAADKGTMSEA